MCIYVIKDVICKESVPYNNIYIIILSPVTEKQLSPWLPQQKISAPMCLNVIHLLCVNLSCQFSFNLLKQCSNYKTFSHVPKSYTHPLFICYLTSLFLSQKFLGQHSLIKSTQLSYFFDETKCFNDLPRNIK